MFPKNKRLTKQKEFDVLFKKGRSIHIDVVSIRWQYIGGDLNKYSVLVSTKVSKKAVQRNLIKRRIREILQKEDKLIKKGCNIAILTRPGVDAVAYNELEVFIKDLLKKAALYV